MIGIVYNEAWASSALPAQCIYTWYRQDDQVILNFVRVPDRRPK